jgi:tetratricopeptide (TPR) repeat protein
MGFARSLTLIWPGLPWLWLRGSLGGLILAVGFAVVLDVAILTTWIWSELVDRQVSVGIWSAAGAVWLVATVSALASFPPAIPKPRDAAADALFRAARDAYLAKDWLAAETKLRALLVLAPTDGEAQLLLATLLRRVGRRAEARTALEKLSRSDSGIPWQSPISRELALLDRDSQNDTDRSSTDAIPMPGSQVGRESREKAA